MMDAQAFALSMAHMAEGEFRQLILSVPGKFGDGPLAHDLIRAISHANGMARMLAPEEQQLIARVTSLLVTVASQASFRHQNDAVRKLIRLIVHAHAMAEINPDARPGILPLVEELVAAAERGELPATAQAETMFAER
jgi:hemoglobin-like flavoprotein